MSSANGDRQPVKLSLPLVGSFHLSQSLSTNNSRNINRSFFKSFERKMNLSSSLAVSAFYDF